ncbi:MAG: threonine ammonia-lyase, partial [Dongiaceae bacterium]
MNHAAPRLSLDRIAEAAAVIDPLFRDSPQLECEPLSRALGAGLVLKVETLNPIRSFKGRGAHYYVRRLADRTPLVVPSAGNFGQGLAHAARVRGIPITVFAAETANPLKVARMRAMAATVVLAGDDFDAAKALAKDEADRQGLRFIEDSRDPEPTEGAGTMALEWLSFPERLDALFIPLGNGAMLAGMATVIKARLPQTAVIAVAATGAPAMVESLQSGQRVIHERIETIADGIGVRIPVPEALTDLAGLVDEFV